MDRPLQDQCSQSRQLLRALMPYSCKLPVSKEESFRENNILEQNNVFSSEVRTSIADMLSDETSPRKNSRAFPFFSSDMRSLVPVSDVTLLKNDNLDFS